ncbi:5-formyltetrahydrofolate cyclo-ligase [Spirosoma koreense]
MTKEELRCRYLAERKALSPGEAERRSQLIADRFFDFLAGSQPTDTSAIIHTFLPIRRQNEVDTWQIINRLWQSYPHISVAVPITDSSKNTLSHSLLFSETPLALNRWGIPEPSLAHRHLKQPGDFSLVLVPLLVFDQQGHRVGYGGGYYDRFLAECRPDCLKIGLSLADPVMQIDAIASTDIRLDLCITPTQTYRFE